MKEQFIIRFKDQQFKYQADVKAFEIDGNTVYDVYYSLVPYVHPARKVQVYAGSGKGPVVYWRQRITHKEEELLPGSFIEAVGNAIGQSEK
ncbi:MAG TPA: hypothetical protein VFC34_16275 [Puia sp.]|nr:hypothetical protein [Puia sp.]